MPEETAPETVDQTRKAIADARIAFQTNRYGWAMGPGPVQLFDILDALTIRQGALEVALSEANAAP